ncbi:MAG: penicillin-binding protein 2 [Candidatus Doudnabacteria bacterium]|nr:penicillin-binding protein 2 [Candidatus Doudnabacteria bacterium]
MNNPFREIDYINRKIERGKELGFDEVYKDSLTDSDRVLEDERIALNYRFLGLCVILMFTLLAGRVIYLQTIRGEEYRSMAEGNKLRIQYLFAPRGLILDRFGKIIASNVPSFELIAIPAYLPKEEPRLTEIITKISKITARPYEELSAQINKAGKTELQPITILQNLPKEQALVLISASSDFPGFEVQDSPIRDYKDPLVFAHLTGYTGKISQDELAARQNKDYLFNDFIGKTGLEVFYEDFLRGSHGQKQTEMDATGKIKDEFHIVPSTPGSNIKTSIDYDLQKVIYDNLISVMGRGRAKRAAAVATNPKTGEVLSLISLPSFDSNLFARGISAAEYQSLASDPNNPLLNRVLSGTYPPGSTVKPMLAQAALTEGTITPETKILDDGVIRIGNFTFYGYDRNGLGLMDVYSAIARSSDIFFYTLGGGNPKNKIQGLGPDKVAEWFRKFHLGKALGIDLPSEKDGLVPDPDWKQQERNEQWYLGDTYHFSIGQGDLLATPLQVNSWTATIASGGKIMRPIVVSEASDQSGKILLKKEPEVLSENFLDPKWLKVVQDGMRQTITAGSAQSLNTLPMEISGKTGTAQFDAKNMSRTHAWFTSYAPSADPQIALTILVESGGEGSSVAVPVAKGVYDWWFKNRLQK